MKTANRFVCLLALLLLPTMVAAQSPDLSGVWDITADAAQGEERGLPTACMFAGTAEVADVGGDLSGGANMTLVSGPASCPAQMSAGLTGSVDGTAVNLQLNDATLGTANLDGMSSGQGVSGSMSVSGGPFAGYGGSFNATFRGTLSTIPTLSNVAIVAFALMLAGLGLLRARDRKRAT